MSEKEKEVVPQEELDYIEKVFFEEDEKVRLRDGKEYRIPPLALNEARVLFKLINQINVALIFENLMPKMDDENNPTDEDNYDKLMDVLLMAFKPYYSHMTREYLGRVVDLNTAKQIIEIMIGLNSLKKSL